MYCVWALHSTSLNVNQTNNSTVRSLQIESFSLAGKNSQRSPNLQVKLVSAWWCKLKPSYQLVLACIGLWQHYLKDGMASVIPDSVLDGLAICHSIHFILSTFAFQIFLIPGI
jgi:hypothetical protein